MSVQHALDHLNIALLHLVEAQLKMSVTPPVVPQGQFDTDLQAYLTANTAYQTAVNAYILAVGQAAPNLATEDASVAAAQAQLATAQTALTAAAP
jgi:hypothetical protein